MGDERQLLGPAAAQWNDYVGTAAADDADALARTRGLYDITGLDRDRWTIVSIDLDQWASAQRVTVYAFDRLRYNINTHADLQEFGYEQGELPVTAFHLDDPAMVDDFRSEAFKRMAVRLTSRAVSDQSFVVDQHQHLKRSVSQPFPGPPKAV